MFIAEYDGKKYTIDDYIIMVEDAINGKNNALSILLEHGAKLSSLGYEYPPYGLDDWLFFIARNGKAEWAIDKLYMRRRMNNDNEAAIYALEEGVGILEKKGQYAPQAWYTLINNYYYNKVDHVSDGDYIEKEYLMNKTGTWYKKGVEAGCDPEVLEGRVWAEKPVNFSSSNNSNKSDTSGCYIATAVYGSYDCPEVWTLRRFRDNILSQHLSGKMFIKIYYKTSPWLVKHFGKTTWFNKLFRSTLDNFVGRLNAKGISSSHYTDK